MPSTTTAVASSVAPNPLLRPSSVVLGMLALSIGWGIRGNFGHEYGAMIAGALCAIAISLFSGREDWRSRVPYFAVFGAMGWGFGGSMSYMPTIGYTHSGQLPTQLYGFFAVFCIGFLWASMGGAGTAFAAVGDRERLTAFFRPLCWILAFWALDYYFRADLIRWYEHAPVGEITRDFRQRNPFYWLDADWLGAWRTIVVICAFDLWDRRFEKWGSLAGFSAIGALVGFLIQRALAALGWLTPLLHLIVHPQGDLSAINPATGQLFDPNDLVTNWPQVFTDLGPHMGWIVGLIAGASIYFYRYGKWRSGSSLLMHMAVGGFAMFLVFPVLLSNLFLGVGGFRMVPPRGDNWATVLGVLLGFLLYAYRNGLAPAASAALISGVVGGLGFMFVQFLKILAFMPGNPRLIHDASVIQAWAHWHSANWHSILDEQGAGLFYGLGIVLAMAAVSARVKQAPAPEPRPRRWTEALSVAFIVNWLVYVNLVKNVAQWTTLRQGGYRAMPLSMKAPLIGAIQFSALGWFNFFFLLYTICVVALLFAHLHRRLALIPPSWLGKGQLLFLVFVWIMVIGNFERALVGFHEQRLATEGTLFVNALIATFLLLFCARASESASWTAAPFGPLVRKVVAGGLGAMVILVCVYTGVVHGVYDDQSDGWSHNLRFGPNADWRVKPILKSIEHR